MLKPHRASRGGAFASTRPGEYFWGSSLRWKPPRRYHADASMRLCTCSFLRMLWTWFFTVASSMTRRPAIPLLVMPSSTKCRISRSRPVNARRGLCGLLLVVSERSRQRAQPPQQSERDAWRAVQLSAHRAFNGDDEIVKRSVREQIARDSSLGQLDDLGFALTKRDSHHLHVWRSAPDIRYGLHSLGCREVDEHDVRNDFAQ